MPAFRLDTLADRLPPARGRLTPDANIARTSWFRVGGTAEILFEPADQDDVAAFLANLPGDIPVTVIGVGSNLLIRDGGIPGVTIRLGRPFAAITIADSRVTAGAGAVDINVARAARDAGLGGLEFLSGIPGTVGGAVRMNAGAYGGEVADVLLEALALDRAGTVQRVPASALDFSYRHCSAPDDWIFTEAVFRARPDDAAAIAARMDEIAGARGDSQPIRERTGGSTFKNPPDAKAWELIDAAGCRGLMVGGARVSDVHCNFLINTGSATASDLETLGETVRRRVAERLGVTLEWEIRRIGVTADGESGGGS
ncbi:MAG: UDP-N-acetylmuramate dehydrogenase [Alphaproteobacteria bacterium]